MRKKETPIDMAARFETAMIDSEIKHLTKHGYIVLRTPYTNHNDDYTNIIKDTGILNDYFG